MATETAQKREDAEIWEDFASENERLITELQHAVRLAREVRRKIEFCSNLDVAMFRDVERRVYAAYRKTGELSALIDESDAEQE